MTTLRLLSVDNPRPDQRAIAKVIEEYTNTDRSTAVDYAEFLVEGSTVEVTVSANPSSAFRALRKVDVDYEIVE